ncbi:efflux RND transporter periplasmic adaptor subunit [Castellaniella sp. GW247-6E4]|uniref:efflux RND transporter periplasmic adaptor subunit n=1 Tax=Castellaniella sp. GW247-6E4 TaxID=3140380 RepID=UPI00331456E7
MATVSSRRRTILALGLPVLLILGAILWFASRPRAVLVPAPNPATAAVPVRMASVERRDVPIRVLGVGNVEAWASVTVQARIDGQLERIGFTEGQDVTEGQLIAQLDDRVQKAQLDQALAQQARDRASLEYAQQDLRRYETLVKRDAITPQTLDAQRAQVAQLQATLLSDAAQVAAARTQLSYTRITAPISGRAGALLIDPGNIVRAAANQGVVVINQVDPVAVSFTVPDSVYAEVNQALREGRAMRALAYTAGGEQPLAEGRVVLVDNQIDAQSGTLRLKARFDNPGHALWPGQYVDLRLILGERRGALVVPSRAVQRGPEGPLVYVVDAAGVAQVRAVEITLIQDELALIGKGLSEGERVITDGQYKVRPGAHVAEAAPATAPAPAAPPVSPGADPQASGPASTVAADPEAAPLAGASAGAAVPPAGDDGDTGAGQGGEAPRGRP